MILKAAARVFLCASVGFALSEVCLDGQNQRNWSVVHTFAYWGTLQTAVEKMIFLNGWTNGFFRGPRSPAFL
jgi:hypothetical protein